MGKGAVRCRGGGPGGGGGRERGERGREIRRQSSAQSPLVLFVCPRFRTRLSRSLEPTMLVFNFVDGHFFFLIFYCNYFLRLPQFEFSHWDSD